VKRGSTLVLGWLEVKTNGPTLRQIKRMPFPVRTIGRVVYDRFLLWDMSKGAKGESPLVRVAELQPAGLAVVQPDGRLPPELKTTAQPTGDSRIDDTIAEIVAGHIGLAVHRINSGDKVRTVDDRAVSKSLRTLSGGAAESSRRRH
jgi:hypothetical protein